QTLGYSKEEIIGKSSLELNLFINKEEQYQVTQMLSEDGHFREIEMQVRTKQGDIRYGLFSGDTIETQGTNYFLTVMVDITKRKQAEAERKLMETALVHQKQRLSYILEGTNVGTWEWNVQTGETIFNERWANIIGYTLEEISPVSIETWEKFTHPDDLEVSNELLKKHFSNELDFYECEARMKHKDGTWVWVLDRGRVISRAKNGKPLMVMGTHQEITERKQAEENLISEHNRLNSILDVIPSGIYIVSQQGNIEYVNPAIQEAFGPVNGQKCYEYFHDLTHHCPWCKNKDVFSGKSVRWEWYSEKNQKYYDLFDAPIMNVDGSISKFEISNDITALKLSEKKIKRSEEKYRSILHSMKDAAYICSQDFKIEYMNPAMIERFGAGAIGEHCYKIIYDRSEQCSWCVFDQIQKGEDINYEVSNPKDNCYYSVTNSPIFHVDGKVSKLTIFHDITEIKNIEAQLQQSRKMESIGTLTGGIAHDFNNLLYMISGNTELALEDIPNWNPAYLNLQEIKTASLKAADIVKQLLHFSRKTGQKLEVIDAATVIKDSMRFLRSTIPTTIEIKTQLPDTEISILADPIQINQIMMNLCVNATHAMEETGGTLEVNMEISSLDKETIKSYKDLETADNYLKIILSDTGPGIPPEIINRIFDPYFTTKEFGKGSGMGLTVVQGIVKNHDGVITVNSQVGEGTAFTILFPVIDDAPEIITKKTDIIPHGIENILFVDDEKAITNMMQQVLKKLGYHVETSLNPEEALDLFQAKPDLFDIVITDMTMPQMTGAKFAERLKEIRYSIPIILCTGHSSLIDEDKAKQLGIDGFVMKPVSKSKIAKAIRKALDR
ncbi:MAG: PAS domain S-box protein, partial [Desulfobacteraceae bacterium]|nr:PAS domain S-box protein [Desulfobacteraceae bacterium]